ncbi:glycoside hydrolase superfamily [Xylariaceae sp. FL0016]|nr:glycoside hydrolase superfamily [Xylariaceae sp. FL0016]
MSRRYSFDAEPDERDPLDNPIDPYTQIQARSRHPPASSHHSSPTRHHDPAPYQDQPPSPYRDHDDSRYASPSRVPAGPGAHPDSSFARLRQNRLSGGTTRKPIAAGAGAGAAAGGAYALAEASSSRPAPPAHRDPVERAWGHEAQPSITPGADNFSEAAAGGIPGLAISVAERNARESGMDAMRSAQQYQQAPSRGQAVQRSQQPPYNESQGYDYDRGYEMSGYGHGNNVPYDHSYNNQHSSPSLAPLGAAALAPSTRSVNSYSSDPFRDPHMAYGQRLEPSYGQFNPNEIDDDGDDGLEYRRSARNSMLSLGTLSNRGNGASATAGGVGAAAAGGVVGGMMSRNGNNGGSYDPVHNASSGGLGDPGMAARTEKSEWIAKQNRGRKRWTWIIVIAIVLVVAGAVVGGVLGGIVFKKGGSGSGDSTQSADSDTAANGDLDINSSEIQKLLNNPDLHKVFPGVDYTPINVQYPDCLKNPPSQNNVTRDVAVLSQLTNTIRLYGTDCNQTEMTIHALKQLKMEDTMKIWLGVWQDGNDTTNERQLNRMWNILDEYGDTHFKGLIVGNEILFRKQMTATQLGNLLDSVRSNLSDHGWSLPVATSDLGDNWDSSLASISDYIMGNVHPFFAGVSADIAASWTWTFWHGKAGSFFKSDTEKNVISEIGWPTKGGTDCGEADTCDDGAVASIDGLNTLLDTWVCQALDNGTNYFWFEMFDEPWKISFDEPGKEWEDQWGIMDVNRNIKDGVKIPDCGGKEVS